MRVRLPPSANTDDALQASASTGALFASRASRAIFRLSPGHSESSGFFASAPVTGGPRSAKSPAWRQVQVEARGDLILVTQRISGAFSGDREAPKGGE